MSGSGDLTTTCHGGVGLSAQADKLSENDSGNERVPENMKMFLMTGIENILGMRGPWISQLLLVPQLPSTWEPFHRKGISFLPQAGISVQVQMSTQEEFDRGEGSVHFPQPQSSASWDYREVLVRLGKVKS